MGSLVHNAPPRPCPQGDDCGHTVEEHRAFDQGVTEGERTGLESDPPFDAFAQSDLRWAWLSGQSVGSLNRGRA